jgi:hypothetical protein
MTDIDGWERIRLQLARAKKERSYAQEQRFYGDPAKNVKFEREKKTPPAPKLKGKP